MVAQEAGSIKGNVRGRVAYIGPPPTDVDSRAKLQKAFGYRATEPGTTAGDLGRVCS